MNAFLAALVTFGENVVTRWQEHRDELSTSPTFDAWLRLLPRKNP